MVTAAPALITVTYVVASVGHSLLLCSSGTEVGEEGIVEVIAGSLVLECSV